MTELSGAYDPQSVEKEIYAAWEASGMFDPDNLPVSADAENFAIFLPLPNVTGVLHMGHALNASISDALVRFHRMKGARAVWFPGTDHAGIATQNAVEKELRKEGVSRHDLGREKFAERVWEWKKKYGDIIAGQFRTLGASCDWGRARFTMDQGYADEVMRVFVRYFEKGLLYRALRTVNWCVRCQTGISDLEVEYREENAILYHVQYGPFVVATSRPETKFGDVALAVNPADGRYKAYIGKEIEIETLDVDGELDVPRKKSAKLMVVGDEAADIAFGTGVIKVTPAHDMTDFEIGARHGLPSVAVITPLGKMAVAAGKYAGMKVAEARAKIAEDLRAMGLLVKEEAYARNLAVCSRCASAIEPMPSRQWFLKMGDLAEKAREAVASGATKILPENFSKAYFAWLENTRDWCVSRQLWWGHRLPVWFCAMDGEKYAVSLERPAKCAACGACETVRSEDVLDTWFSSALWPFAGLSEKDLLRFYPSSVLVTARDIINLWVGRMIFSGLEFRGAVPFPEALIHATVLTKDGKRMSKSLGTGIDPLVLAEKYGADAVRFGMLWQAMGTQDMRFDEAAVIAGKKFANKIWNASRFVLGRIGDTPATAPDPEKYTEADRLILEKFAAAKRAVEDGFAKYEFGQALHAAYDFFWKDFCDAYLESAKAQEGGETARVLHAVLRDSLKLLHPFMPFVTEAVWKDLPEGKEGMLMVARW